MTDGKYELVIFDFDGTLAETRASILTTIERVLELKRKPAMASRDVERLIGLPLSATFEAAGFRGQEVDEAVRLYREHYDSVALATVTLFEGVAPTLARLRERGKRLAIASSKGKAVIPRILRRLGVENHFDVIAGEQDSERKKPAPDLTLFVLSGCGVSPERSIVVGDTRYDIEMGRSAGCDTCAVTFGYGKDVLDAAPTYAVDRFPALLEYIA